MWYRWERERVGYPWEAAREEAFDNWDEQQEQERTFTKHEREREREPRKACRASESKWVSGWRGTVRALPFSSSSKNLN